MGGPITTLFMPMSAEGSSTSLSDYAKVLKYLSDHLSEWPLFFNPASHSFLQKWLIYALSGSRQIVYKKQCSIRDAEVAGSNPVASTLYVQGFRETETLNFFLKVDFSLTFL